MNLVKGFTNEELCHKAEYEGIEYLFLDYLSLDDIIDHDLAEAVHQFKLAFEEIQAILEDNEIGE